MGAGIPMLDETTDDEAVARPKGPPYHDVVRVDDLVRLPDGRPGVVTHVEFLPRRGAPNFVRFGNGTELRYSKVVSVRPSRLKKRFLGLLKELPSRFADGEIERLEFIASSEELDAIDPEAL
jgi:hypothetical protein